MHLHVGMLLRLNLITHNTVSILSSFEHSQESMLGYMEERVVSELNFL